MLSLEVQYLRRWIDSLDGVRPNGLTPSLYSTVAQGLERDSYKVLVGGSIPPCTITFSKLYRRITVKVYTSYFYKIRSFKPNMIPVSTAIWDPKWFHAEMGQDYIWFDKNGVVNGLRVEELHPRIENSECMSCKDHNRTTCEFKRLYEEQISKLDFKVINDLFEEFGRIMKEERKVEGEPVIVLIVHEAPNNHCSEREILQKYFHAEELQV